MQIMIGSVVITQKGNLLVKQAGTADHVVGYMRNGMQAEDMFESLSLRDEGCVLCKFAKFNEKEKNYDCYAKGVFTIKDLLLEEIGRHCKSFAEDFRKTVCYEIESELTSMQYTLARLRRDEDEDSSESKLDERISPLLEQLAAVFVRMETECRQILDRIYRLEAGD